MLNLFDDKNVAALLTSCPEASGTINFLKIIISWWNIVNVKTPYKGQAKNLDEAIPVTSPVETDPKFRVLSNFCKWLNVWENLQIGEASKKCN